MVLTTAIALPLQQIVLCLRPLLGNKLAETFFWGDGISLVLVLAGFTVYEACSPEGVARRFALAAPLPLATQVEPSTDEYEWQVAADLSAPLAQDDHARITAPEV